MRLDQRGIDSQVLFDSVSTLEVIEAYPRDKYLPSFLLRGKVEELVFHAQVATDVEGDNVRVVTMHIPNPEEWEMDGRVRRNPR